MATTRTARTTKKRAATKSGSRAAKIVEPKGMTSPRHDQIAAEAYKIWIANHRPEGQAYENWIQAEARLTLGL